MSIRDEVEAVLRAWDAHERRRGGNAIVDYDCRPTDDPVFPAPHRLWVLDRLSRLSREAADQDEQHIVDRLRADLAYLRALLGERAPIEQYIRDTQGVTPRAWDDDALAECRSRAVTALDRVGVRWSPALDTDLRELDGPLSIEDVDEAIWETVRELEPRVRQLTGTTAPYTLDLENVDLDAYWTYWLDGAGANARLRLNLRHARFTMTRARQFAMHEVLGHALQCASFAHQASLRDVTWVRIMSVHTPHQVLLEGLAQALPLFVTPDEPVLIARVRMTHYAQLVNARIHLAINSGVPADQVAREVRSLMPHWDDAEISDALADRGTDPLLRSYLWSYPAGVDWFARLADTASQDGIHHLLRAAYRDPLSPAALDSAHC